MKTKNVEIHALDVTNATLAHVFFIDNIGPYYVTSVMLDNVTAEYCETRAKGAVNDIIDKLEKKYESNELMDAKTMAVNMFGVKYKNDVN